MTAFSPPSVLKEKKDFRLRSPAFSNSPLRSTASRPGAGFEAEGLQRQSSGYAFVEGLQLEKILAGRRLELPFPLTACLPAAPIKAEMQIGKGIDRAETWAWPKTGQIPQEPGLETGSRACSSTSDNPCRLTGGRCSCRCSGRSAEHGRACPRTSDRRVMVHDPGALIEPHHGYVRLDDAPVVLGRSAGIWTACRCKGGKKSP